METRNLLLTTYVFTTKAIVYDKNPILRVIYDNDGDWQFLDGQKDLKVEDAMLISLGEILQLDSSLDSIVPLLNPGEMAIRKRQDSSWIIVACNDC